MLAFAQGDESQAGIEELLAEFAQRGAKVMAAGSGSGHNSGVMPLPALAAHPVLAPIAFVQSFYRMANALSVARGFDPDRPPHLRKVTSRNPLTIERARRLSGDSAAPRQGDALEDDRAGAGR